LNKQRFFVEKSHRVQPPRRALALTRGSSGAKALFNQTVDEFVRPAQMGA
jgi:hypothetical protein